MLTLHSMKYILIDFTMTKNPICVLPYMYDMAKFRASADFLYQRKPLILSYFLKLACLSSLFDALSEVRKINDLRRFCCLRVSYSPNFVLFQHFSEHFYRSFMIPLRHKHIRFPARISSVICSNRTENFLLF